MNVRIELPGDEGLADLINAHRLAARAWAQDMENENLCEVVWRSFDTVLRVRPKRQLATWPNC
jgi:hypothetical protein